MAELLVGASRTDITPPSHVPYLGSEPRQGLFEGVHDPLYARAAVFTSGDESLAILSADALGLSRDLLGPGRDFIDEVCVAACARIRLDPDAVLLAATHAHSTPETYGITRIWERGDCGEWLESLVETLADTITSAWQDRSPAELRIGAGSIDGMTCNRRAAFGGPAPVDESVAVLLAERPDASPVVLANATCHPVTVQVQPLISADFPGVAAALVEAALGGTCLFLQGASGDINPIGGHTGEWRDVETYGLTLAGGILQGVGSARLSGAMQPVLSAALVDMEVSAREAPSREDARAALADGGRAAGEAYRLAQFGPGPITVDLQALRIGDMAIAAFPGELFCELGLQLKADSPADLTMIAECANGCVGYLATEDAWDRGGYEVGMGAWCRVARGEAERMVAQARELVGGLF